MFEYVEGSIKESTLKKRGKGLRRKVARQVKVPSNWLSYLLTLKVSKHNFPPGEEVHVTSGNNISSLCTGAFKIHN